MTRRFILSFARKGKNGIVDVGERTRVVIRFGVRFELVLPRWIENVAKTMKTAAGRFLDRQESSSAARFAIFDCFEHPSCNMCCPSNLREI